MLSPILVRSVQRPWRFLALLAYSATYRFGLFDNIIEGAMAERSKAVQFQAP